MEKQDLTKFGHSDVLKSALFQIHVHRDIEVLSVAYVCTFKFLKKIVVSKDVTHFDTWDEFTKKVVSMNSKEMIEFTTNQFSRINQYFANLKIDYCKRLIS